MLRMSVTSYQVNKCVTVSRMLSGRFRCGSLLRHFHPHISGICELCGLEQEDLAHIVVPRCPELKDRAHHLIRFARETLQTSEKASTILETTLGSKDDNKIVQLFLDPSVVPEVIAAEQTEPGTLNIILNVTTTWCYALNKTRIKLLGI